MKTSQHLEKIFHLIIHYTAIATKISTSYKNNMTLFGVKTLIIPLKKKNLYWKPLKAWQKKCQCLL